MSRIDNVEYLSALSDALKNGVSVDPESVFNEVNRQRDSGDLAQSLLDENSYLVSLDENGLVLKVPGRKNP